MLDDLPEKEHDRLVTERLKSLPTGRRAVSMFGWTDTGLRRTNNEDAFCLSPTLGLAVVCDGVGGSAAGEHASRIAAAVMSDHVKGSNAENPELRMRDAILAANRAVTKDAESGGKRHRMATTLVAAMKEDDSVVIGHVGDSRAYCWRAASNVLEPLTRDHNFLNALQDSGKDIDPDLLGERLQGSLTQAVGREGIDPSIKTISVKHGDVVILCSDGLTGMVSEDEIGALIRTHGLKGNLRGLPQVLVEAALVGGGKDNITVAIMPIAAAARVPMAPK